MVKSMVLLYTPVFQRYVSAFNMSLSMENIIKGLKEVTRKIEEGGEVDSNIMGIVEEFLENFPPPTTLTFSR